MNLREYWTEDRLSNLNKFVIKAKITNQSSLWDFITANNNKNEEYRISVVRHSNKNTTTEPNILGAMYIADCKLCVFAEQELRSINIVPTYCDHHEMCRELGNMLVTLANIDNSRNRAFKPIFFHYTTVAELYKQ